MSFILDALRRAEAERQRGNVPDLQHLGSLPAAMAPAPSPLRRALPWMVAALALALAAVLWWARHERPVPMAVPLPASAPVAAPPVAASVPAPRPVPLPAPMAAPTPMPAAVAPVAPVAPRVASAAASRSAAPAPAPVGASAPEAPRVVALGALPEPQRSAVQRLAFGGAVHSADRAQSFVLLNGQIVREGETVAPGVVLERITPGQVTLRVGDLRVERPL